jgi:anthranilate phosphoribosyltransferase
MPPLREILERLLQRRNLSETESEDVLAHLADPDTAPALAGAVLAALRSKGVVADEVRGFAKAMRRLARRPQIPPGIRALDIVGTGGDASGSLNISTGTALLTAACGLPVVKHGNRSVSSRAGSADVLEALGLPLPLDEKAAGRCFAALHFTFLFAPYYHAATKSIAPVRAALGVRTVFNILGPLSNPAEPPFLVVGAFDAPTAELMAQALHGTHVQRAFVIHGAEGWDEPTPVGEFTLFDVSTAGVRREQRSPADYGLARCASSELAGADAAHNARELRRVLCGERLAGADAGRDPHRDAVLLGTALALEVSGRESSPRAAMARAAQAIEAGRGAALLARLASFGADELRRTSAT